jgi:hypothetical protein
VIGPAEYALRAAYAEHNPGAAILQPALDASRAEDAANAVFRRLVADAADAIVRALEITLRDAPGSATETMLRRWLDEVALSHNVEPMPEGVFDGSGAEILSQATAAYWSCKLAQRGVRLTGGAR